MDPIPYQQATNVETDHVSDQKPDDIYQLSPIPIEFGNEYHSRQIISQNANGPCPLIAICN